MCLTNVTHKHLTTQTGKKSKPALINVIGPGAEGPRAGGREKQIPVHDNQLKQTFFIKACILN